MRINTYALYQQKQGKIYIINGCSLRHFYKKKLFSQTEADLCDTFIKKNFFSNKYRQIFGTLL